MQGEGSMTKRIKKNQHNSFLLELEKKIKRKPRMWTLKMNQMYILELKNWVEANVNFRLDRAEDKISKQTY